MGYETAYYAVTPGRSGALRVEFISAEITKDGETVKERHPYPWRLRLPARASFVRLVYLRRVSQADHDMAVVAAADRLTLDALTRQVQTEPTSACRAGVNSFCTWVPAGIAVRPERRGSPTDPESWVPAR